MTTELQQPANKLNPLGNDQRRKLLLHLAQNIATARHRSGLTQQKLAEAAELSRATINLIEAGACDPRLSTITSLANALGLDATRLFDSPTKSVTP